MVEKADGTKSPWLPPKHCTQVADLQLRNRDIRRLSAFISKQNDMEWYVDIRRPDVCLSKLLTNNNLGLFYIISPLSSHWTTCYFIHGRRGVSVVRWTGAGRAADDIRAALARHQADFSPAETERMIHYFDK